MSCLDAIASFSFFMFLNFFFLFRFSIPFLYDRTMTMCYGRSLRIFQLFHTTIAFHFFHIHLHSHERTLYHNMVCIIMQKNCVPRKVFVWTNALNTYWQPWNFTWLIQFFFFYFHYSRRSIHRNSSILKCKNLRTEFFRLFFVDVKCVKTKTTLKSLCAENWTEFRRARCAVRDCALTVF